MQVPMICTMMVKEPSIGTRVSYRTSMDLDLIVGTSLVSTWILGMITSINPRFTKAELEISVPMLDSFVPWLGSKKAELARGWILGTRVRVRVRVQVHRGWTWVHKSRVQNPDALSRKLSALLKSQTLEPS